MPTSGNRRRAAKRRAVPGGVSSRTHSNPGGKLPDNRILRIVPTIVEEVDSVSGVAPSGRYKFWLVQCLESLKPRDPWLGITALFDFEIMESPEFDFGAILQSLRRIRIAGDLVIEPVEIVRNSATDTVYFVGPRSQLAEKIADFRVWFSLPTLMTREPCDFDFEFAGCSEPSYDPEYASTDAWWSLDSDITWTLDPKIAALLLEGLTPRY